MKISDQSIPVQKLIACFLESHELQIVAELSDGEITVKDASGFEHYFVLYRNGPQIRFLCDSYESDDKSRWGIVTW